MKANLRRVVRIAGSIGLTVGSAALFAAPLTSLANFGKPTPGVVCHLLDKTFGTPVKSLNYIEWGVDYSCVTAPLQVGVIKDASSNPLLSSIMYSVHGTASDARSLRLKLNVNQKLDVGTALTKFADLAAQLHSAATGSELAAATRSNILAQKPFQARVGAIDLALSRTVWPTGAGYELNFSITAR